MLVLNKSEGFRELHNQHWNKNKPKTEQIHLPRQHDKSECNAHRSEQDKSNQQYGGKGKPSSTLWFENAPILNSECSERILNA